MKRIIPFISFIFALAVILTSVASPAAVEFIHARTERSEVGSSNRADTHSWTGIGETDGSYKESEELPSAAINKIISANNETTVAAPTVEHESLSEKTEADFTQNDIADPSDKLEESKPLIETKAQVESLTEDTVPSAVSSVRNATTGTIPPIKTIDTFVPMEFAQDYTAMLTSVDERHIYTFTVTERGFLQYSVKHAELQNFMGWEITLYREHYLNGVDGEIGYMPMNLLKTTALNTTESSPTVGVMPGDYRIVVKATSGISAEEYTLNASFTAAMNHEIECNDTKAAYTELYPGIPMVGSASCYTDKQDDDWYLLRVQKDGKATITFTHEKSDNVSVAWRVVLYDENGTELYSENSGMNTETVYSGEIGLTKGIYFISVLCRVRCDADYTLSVSTAADDRFERENNDSMATANTLALGGTVNGCITSKAGKLDRDFYRFEMPVRGNFSMVFSHAPANAADTQKKDDDKNGWNVRLLSASGQLIYSMISTWNSATVKMPVMGLEAGVYYVEINSEDLYRNTLTYTLIAGNTESASFEMEPNNTPETATPIAQGVPVTGAIIDATDPDDDYYSFSVAAYSRITAVLKHESNGTERDIFSFSVWNAAGEKMPVYSGREPMTDVNGNNVYYVKSLGNQTSVTAYFELPAGTYYFKLTSGRFFDEINYSIEYYIN